MQTEVTRRIGAAKANARKELLGDESFQQEVLQTLGIDPKKQAKGGKKDLTDEELAGYRQAWEKQYLEPVKSEQEKLASRVQALTTAKLHSEIVAAAAAAGVKQAFLKPAVEGGTPPIVGMFAGQFGEDDHGNFSLRNGPESFAYSATPTSAKPYKSVAEFFQQWAADKSNAEMLQQRQMQSGPGGGASVGTGGVITITRSEARNHDLFVAAEAAAKAAGTRVQIIDG